MLTQSQIDSLMGPLVKYYPINLRNLLQPNGYFHVTGDAKCSSNL